MLFVFYSFYEFKCQLMSGEAMNPRVGNKYNQSKGQQLFKGHSKFKFFR